MISANDRKRLRANVMVAREAVGHARSDAWAIWQDEPESEVVAEIVDILSHACLAVQTVVEDLDVMED